MVIVIIRDLSPGMLQLGIGSQRDHEKPRSDNQHRQIKTQVLPRTVYHTAPGPTQVTRAKGCGKRRACRAEARPQAHPSTLPHGIASPRFLVPTIIPQLFPRRIYFGTENRTNFSLRFWARHTNGIAYGDGGANRCRIRSKSRHSICSATS